MSAVILFYVVREEALESGANMRWKEPDGGWKAQQAKWLFT
jgi:hypothetical protein